MRLWVGGTAESWVANKYDFGSHSLAAFTDPGVAVTFWDAEEGGTQHTDLLDADDNPVSQATTVQGGWWGPIQLPDGIYSAWAQAGDGGRRWLVIGRSAEDAAGLAAHASATTDVHGIADTADLQTASGLDADVAALAESGASDLGASLTATFAAPRGYITTTDDLNNYSSPGVWRIAGSATGSANMPNAATGTLVVTVAVVADNHLVQMFHEDNGPTYSRQRAGTTWRAWGLLGGTTGRRNIDSLVVNGWTIASQTVGLIRNGSSVEFFANVNGGDATSTVILTLPTGFRPPAWLSWFAPIGTSPTMRTEANQWRIRSSGEVEAPMGVNNLYLLGSYFTDDPWPTTLPGTGANP